MPGHSGRNKHSVLVDVTETNLATQPLADPADPAKKQSVDHWLDHVVLPPALRHKRNKLPHISAVASTPALHEALAGWFARRMIELARGLPGFAVVRLREEEEEEKEEEEEEEERNGEGRAESNKSKAKKMRGRVGREKGVGDVMVRGSGRCGDEAENTNTILPMRAPYLTTFFLHRRHREAIVAQKPTSTARPLAENEPLNALLPPPSPSKKRDFAITTSTT